MVSFVLNLANAGGGAGKKLKIFPSADCGAQVGEALHIECAQAEWWLDDAEEKEGVNQERTGLSWLGFCSVAKMLQDASTGEEWEEITLDNFPTCKVADRTIGLVYKVRRQVRQQVVRSSAASEGFDCGGMVLL
jgi:hypothetical protein